MAHGGGGIRGHIAGIDALRLNAAAMVMGYHLGLLNWLGGRLMIRAIPDQAPPFPPMWSGWVGVEIFFVISGFVIACSAATSGAAGFLRSRFLRLAPVSWIAATIALLVLLAGAAATPATLFGQYAATLAFCPFEHISGVWWTLTVEIEFYLFVCALIALRRLAMLETAMIVLGVGCGLLLATGLVLHAQFPDAGGAIGRLRAFVERVELSRKTHLLLVPYGAMFALGVVLWRATDAGLTRGRVLAMCLLFAASVLEITQRNIFLGAGNGWQVSPLPAILVFSAAMAAMVLSIRLNDRISRRAARWLPPIRFIGLATYRLYLVHEPMGYAAAMLLRMLPGQVGAGTAAAVGMVAALAAAVLIAAVPEPWLRRGLASVIPPPRLRVMPLAADGMPTRSA